jgi:hypothetical protein
MELRVMRGRGMSAPWVSCGPRRDRRMGQAHRPRPGCHAAPRRLPFLVQPLLAQLVQLCHLLPHLLALLVTHRFQPQSPPRNRVGCQLVQRHG